MMSLEEAPAFCASDVPPYGRYIFVVVSDMSVGVRELARQSFVLAHRRDSFVHYVLAGTSIVANPNADWESMPSFIDEVERVALVAEVMET